MLEFSRYVPISFDLMIPKGTVCASSGEEAVERTFAAHSRREDYFAVILDWKMPGKDGVDTTKEIRSVDI